MKNMSKVFGIIAMIAVIGFMAAGCENPANGDKEKKTKSYTVTFDSRGGTAVAAKTVEEGGTISLPANPVRDGFIFDGWFTDNGAWQKPFTATTPVTGNMTVFAKWTELPPDTYSITYNLNGGTNDSGNPASYTEETETITLKDPSKEGFLFAGWFDNEDFTGDAVTTIAKGSEGNKIFYAKWTELPPGTFSISYNLNGGTNDSGNPASYTEETETITLKAANRTGYTFAGWFDNAEFNGTAVTEIEKGSIGNKILYAKWTAIPYSISYNLNGGTNDSGNPVSYTEETETITLKAPSRAGYTFDGWFDNAEFNGTAVTSITKGSTGDKIFFAKWSLITYTISYNLNGGTNDSGNPASYTEETETITLKAPSRAGYTFAGWFDNAEFNGTAATSIAKGSTGDKIFYANWIKNTYTVTFYSEGIEVQTIPVEYGETIELPAAPTREGFLFAGWYTTESYVNRFTSTTVITYRRDVYAKWLSSPVRVYELAEYLSILSDNGITTTSTAPATVKLIEGINISNTWGEINAIVMAAEVYIILDISDCLAYGATVTGVRYNPSGNDMNIIQDNQYIKGLILPTYLGSIGDYAFTDCDYLTSVIIPDSINTIGEFVFLNCRSLTEITIPNSVTSMGQYAFSSCYSLSEVTLSNSITTIGHWTFNNNSSLTKITIPNSVTTIGTNAFLGCLDLTQVSLGANVTMVASSFRGDFKTVYDNGGKVAGTYTTTNETSSPTWLKR